MSEKHVAILREAQRLIEEFGSEFVCCAIKLAAEHLHDVPYRAGTVEPHHCEKHMEVYELLNTIETSIGDRYTVAYWLLEEHDIRLEGDERRAYRMAWIDSMIEYWKDKP